MSKSKLISEIDMLKVDIQYLIDKKKSQNISKEEILKIDDEKKSKMNRLKMAREELKDVQKRERTENQKQNACNSVIRTLNSMDFQFARSKGTANAIEKAKIAKEARDSAREKYLEFLDSEAKYNSIDTPELPGMLFLHPNIVRKYGVCPYINIDLEKDTRESLYQQRKEWLEQQIDKGEEYTNMFNNLIKQL